MARPLRLGALALLVVSVALLPLVSSAGDYKHCEGVLKGWADSFGESEKDGDKLSLKDLLFFLHIPRTGGRTYFHCFLKKLYTNAQECPRSYDKLRFDPREMFNDLLCSALGAATANEQKLHHILLKISGSNQITKAFPNNDTIFSSDSKIDGFL